MLIHEIYRKSAAVLYRDRTIKGTVQRIADATAFFVSAPIVEGKSRLYVVTARHASAGMAWLRLNYKSDQARAGGQGFVDLPMPPSVWVQHDATDVAVASMKGHPDVNSQAFDVLPVPVHAMAGSEFAKTLGLGDDVFFVSLFIPSPGEDRFEPIIRFGNISRMADEKIRIQMDPLTTGLVNAYLVEARSWGGHSGSPAFVYQDPRPRKTDRIINDSNTIARAIRSRQRAFFYQRNWPANPR